MTDVSPNMPNFFMIGFPKTGTTSLHHYMSQHPEVFAPRVKEPSFFNLDAHYSRGTEWYLSEHYQRAASYGTRLDSTVNYVLRSDTVIPRMLSTFPSNWPRFVVVLRNPIDRAWSHYHHRFGRGQERESFERSLELERQGARSRAETWAFYYNDGLYAQHLRPWLDAFGSDRFLFLLTEELKIDAAAVTTRLFRYFGVDEQFTVDTSEVRMPALMPRQRWLLSLARPPAVIRAPISKTVPKFVRRSVKRFLNRRSTTPYKERPEMNASTKAMLRDRYEPEIARLEVMIGFDLSSWRCA